jgi:uncharacterized protein YfeS
LDFDDHDPWNEPSHRHPRAGELMREEVLWDCVNELAPFGSDEGADAYVEYRNWREQHRDSNLFECIAWILGGNCAPYNAALTHVESIRKSDESAQGFGFSDAFTLDATIIATVLGQLVEEGRIDSEAKQFGLLAVGRQSHPIILAGHNSPEAISERRHILDLVRKVIEAA